MARVNVEQKAFTDGRFRTLGLSIGVRMNVAQAAGIGLMTLVWNQCQERESYTLTEQEIDGVCGIRGVAAKIVAASLGEQVQPGEIRICGTEQRIEWLGNSKKNGALGGPHGVKGGRPRKTPLGVMEKPPVGFDEKPPLAPALAPAPTPTEKQHQKFSRGAPVNGQERPLSRGQYIYLADQVGKWIEANRDRFLGNPDGMTRAFSERFPMTWEAWQKLKAQHQEAN